MVDSLWAARAAWNEYYISDAHSPVSKRGMGKSLEGCKYINDFTKIANLCIRRQFDVVDYVRQSLDMLIKSTAFILPKDLTTPDSVKRYLQIRVKQGGDVTAKYAWDHQEAYVCKQRIISPTRFTDDMAMLFPSVRPFDSWFRVFYPRVAVTRLVDTYGAEAWVQLQNDNGLRTLMHEMRPDTLKELCNKFGYFGDSWEVNNG